MMIGRSSLTGNGNFTPPSVDGAAGVLGQGQEQGGGGGSGGSGAVHDWRESHQLLLHEWKRQAAVCLWLQIASHYHYSRINNILTYPTVIITAFTSVGVWGIEGSTAGKYVMSSVSLVAGILATVSKHCRAAEKSNEFQLRSKEYLAIIREIDYILALDEDQRPEVGETLMRIRATFDRIMDLQLDPPLRVIRAYEDRFRSLESSMFGSALVRELESSHPSTTSGETSGGHQVGGVDGVDGVGARVGVDGDVGRHRPTGARQLASMGSLRRGGGSANGVDGLVNAMTMSRPTRASSPSTSPSTSPFSGGLTQRSVGEGGGGGARPSPSLWTGLLARTHNAFGMNKRLSMNAADTMSYHLMTSRLGRTPGGNIFRTQHNNSRASQEFSVSQQTPRPGTDRGSRPLILGTAASTQLVNSTERMTPLVNAIMNANANANATNTLERIPSDTGMQFNMPQTQQKNVTIQLPPDPTLASSDASQTHSMDGILDLEQGLVHTSISQSSPKDKHLVSNADADAEPPTM